MSPKNPSFSVGLAALGLCGLATWQVAVLAEVPAPGSVPPPAPATSAPSQTQSVLLLTNGRVVQGMLTEEQSEYVLRQKVGVIRFSKRKVEKIFGSLQAVYQYKLSRIAAEDPDEHMKLAKWCLPLKMEAEARAELQAVMNLSPGNGEAKAMLAMLDATAERTARPQIDPGLTQTSATEVIPGPGELNPSAIRSGQPRPNTLGIPVIFDLPPALAVRRTREFAEYVHPQLQRHCVRCHNERSSIPFQLIEAKSKRDYADEMIVRTNMDATLRLVDPENLPNSPLLSNSLLPHKPNNQPILPSPKALAYRTFATWVNSLKASPTPVATGEAGSGVTAASGGFATDRPAAPGSQTGPYTPSATPPSTLPPLPLTPRTTAPMSPGQSPPPQTMIDGRVIPTPTPLPPGQLVPGSYSGPSPYAPENTTFTVPFSVSGTANLPNTQKPQSASVPGAVAAGNPAGAVAGANPSDEPAREIPYAQGTFQPSPGAPPLPVSIPRPGGSATKDKSKTNKPSQIDPAMLEKFYTNRKSQ